MAENGNFEPIDKQIAITSPASKYLNPQQLYFLSLVLITVGLTTSNLFMSLGQFGMAIAWIWQGRPMGQLRNFYRNKPLFLFAGLYLVFIAGLIHTSDFSYALHDLKVKLPLLILPLLIAGFPALSLNHSRWILHAVIITQAVCSLLGWMIFFQMIPWQVDDVRQYSPFISSIRLSTLLALSIFICGWLFTKSRDSWRLFPRIIYWGFAILFLSMLILLQSLTGLIVLILGAWAVCLHWAWARKSIPVRIGSLILSVLIPVSIYLYIKSQVDEFYAIEIIDYNNLPHTTPDGGEYRYDTTSILVENGRYVWMFYRDQEMEAEWIKRSKIPYGGKDANGWPVRMTIARFITSKGWNKDGQAVRNLTDEEIRWIEGGMVNVRYRNKISLNNRVYEVIWEYYVYTYDHDPNGRSLATRIEYAKNGIAAIRKSPWIGYGTGDVRLALNRELETSHSKLERKSWVNPHHQYISITLAVGLIGLVIFLVLFIRAATIHQKAGVLQLAFIVICMGAMLDDDPLETQAGVTQFSLLFCLLFSAIQFQQRKPTTDEKGIS